MQSEALSRNKFNTSLLSRYDRATTRVYWQFMSWLYFVITFKETIIVYMK